MQSGHLGNSERDVVLTKFQSPIAIMQSGHSLYLGTFIKNRKLLTYVTVLFYGTPTDVYTLFEKKFVN